MLVHNKSFNGYKLCNQLYILNSIVKTSPDGEIVIN